MSSGTPSILASPAPLPIPIHLSSLGPSLNQFPGHLSLIEDNSLWVTNPDKALADTALQTVDSWGFPLSPQSAENIIKATPFISGSQLLTIIKGLLTTIKTREERHQEQLESLRTENQQMAEEIGEGECACPEGYIVNDDRIPSFTIPCPDGAERVACFIKQLPDGRVEGLHAQSKGT